MGQPERGGVEFLNRPDERPRGTYEPILSPPRINLNDYNPDDYVIWKTTESNVNVD